MRYNHFLRLVYTPMSIVTMKRRTAATYRASLTGSRGSGPNTGQPGVFSTVGRYRNNGCAVPNPETAFAPPITYDRHFYNLACFARRPAPYSVTRPVHNEDQSQSHYIEARGELERKRLRITENMLKTPDVAPGCGCVKEGCTDNHHTYKDYYHNLQSVCQVTIPTRGVNLVCGNLTEPVCPTYPEQNLSAYPDMYNLGFTKPNMDPNYFAANARIGINNNIKRFQIPNWITGTTNQDNSSYARGPEVTETAGVTLINLGTDPEKGALSIFVGNGNPQICTHTGFPLNPGTYFFTFRCCGVGIYGSLNLNAPPGQIRLEISTDSGDNFRSLFVVERPYFGVNEPSDMMDPRAFYVTPVFSISTYIPNFIIRMVRHNTGNVGSNTSRNTVFDDIQIHKGVVPRFNCYC